MYSMNTKTNHEEQLKRMLEWSVNNVPFYNEHLNNKCENKYTDFPIVDKMSYLVDPKSFMAFDPQKTSLMHFSTSGTTGTPLKVVKTVEDYNAQVKNLWKYRAKMYGIFPFTKTLNLYLYNSQKLSGLSADQHTYYLNISELDMQHFLEVVDEIDDFQPEYILAFTSSILRLFAFYKKSNKPIPRSIRIIECVGEPLRNYQKAFMESLCNATVVLNYSSTEVLGMALSCPCGHMHLISENVMVEIEENQRICCQYEEGNIIITSLHSKAMPFIRYRIGDRGRLIPGKTCSCGNHSDIIEITGGRTSDFIELSKNQRIHSVVLCNVIERISYQLNDCILQFQIKQLSNDELQISLCFKENRKLLLPIFKTLFLSKISNIIDLKSIKWFFNSYDLTTDKISFPKFPVFKNNDY